MGCACLVLALIAGCRLTSGSNESIVRVQVKQNPAQAARLTRSGIASLHKGHVEHAAEQFTAAIAADPAYGPAHNNLGLLHYEQGNLYQAVLAFEQAVEFLPQDPAAVYNLALALESAGRTDEALMLYEQAVEMDPANPNHLGNLVRLKVRMGEHDEHLIAQLQDLVLIETRPQWRRWADKQLALDFNPVLDRGPATPDFDTDEERRRAVDTMEWSEKIIDLTPRRSVGSESGLQSESRPTEGLPVSAESSMQDSFGPESLLPETLPAIPLDSPVTHPDQMDDLDWQPEFPESAFPEQAVRELGFPIDAEMPAVIDEEVRRVKRIQPVSLEQPRQSEPEIIEPLSEDDYFRSH
ncbi:photosystem I assembly protein Ycf3 [Stieleria varia]|uniref:Photosystem I assembly protein Ycf3 n=2 Tax=Stieleria varia TaxID=2528005 RepID=A0A5C6AGU4_9BACT|nr:photosystem I assembly protein Ycf3 [Stieleria varia]